MTICNMSIEAGARAGMIAPGRDDLRLPQGPRPRAEGRRLGRGRRRRGASCAPTTTRCSTPRSHIDADALTPFVTWGTNPGQGLPLGERGARPGRDRRRERARRRREGAGLHGPDGGHAAARDRRRHRVRRLVHQRPHRGPARGRRDHRRPPGGRRRADAGGARLDAGAVPGRGRRASTRSSPTAGAEWRSAGCSMCLGMNPDQLAPGRAQRVDVEPQLRGPPGQGRPHPPRLAARRRRHGRARHPCPARRTCD